MQYLSKNTLVYFQFSHAYNLDILMISYYSVICKLVRIAIIPFFHIFMTLCLLDHSYFKFSYHYVKYPEANRQGKRDRECKNASHALAHCSLCQDRFKNTLGTQTRSLMGGRSPVTRGITTVFPKIGIGRKLQ